MLVIPKGRLKARMLEYFRHVEENGEEIMVTSHGEPVVKVVPLKTRKPPAEVFADLQGKLSYDGDLTEPEAEEWPER